LAKIIPTKAGPAPSGWGGRAFAHRGGKWLQKEVQCAAVGREMAVPLPTACLGSAWKTGTPTCLDCQGIMQLEGVVHVAQGSITPGLTGLTYSRKKTTDK